MVRPLKNPHGVDRQTRAKLLKPREDAIKKLCETMGVNPALGELFLSEIKLGWDNERDWLKQRVRLLGLW